MTTLEQFVSPALTRALGWTLLHSLWQGALVAAVLAGALLVLRRQRAEVRYAAAAAALGLVTALAGITFGLYFFSAPPERAARPQPTEAAGLPTVGAAEAQAPIAALPRRAAPHTPQVLLARPAPAQLAARPPAAPRAEQTLLHAVRTYFDQHLPLLVLAWLLGLLAMSLRLLGGLLYVQRLRHYRVRPLPAVWQERLTALAARGGVRRPVLLLESALVPGPLVVGHLRPLILLPLGAVAGLSVGQLEAILAHELAHVLRRDYLVNLLQTVAEALFFYHPAVWFVAGCVRAERENCCDDTATALVGGDPLRLARALTALAEWSQTAVVPGGPRLALAAMGQRGALLNRVRRLVQRRPAAPTPAEGLLAGALMLGGLSLLGGSVALAGPLAQTAPASREPAALNWQLQAPAHPADTAKRLSAAPAVPAAPAAAAQSAVAETPAAGAQERPRPKREARRLISSSGGAGAYPPGQPGTVIITKDKKGRLTDLVVNGQHVETDGGRGHKGRKGKDDHQVEIIQVGPPAASESRAFVFRSEDDAQRRLFERSFHPAPDFRYQFRELAPLHQPRFNERVFQKLNELPQDQFGRLHRLQPGATFGLQQGPSGQREALRSAEQALQDASTAKNLSPEQRKRIRQSLEKVRAQLRQLDSAASASAGRPLPLNGDLDGEMRQRQEEMRQRQQEMRERIRESQVELQNLQLEQADRNRELAERNRERAEQRREQAEQRRAQDEELVSQLVKDGLIADRNNFQLRLTATSLTVNGKELPAKVHQKYLKLYEASRGHKLSGSSAMVISRSGDGSASYGDVPPPPRPPRAPWPPHAPLAPPPPAPLAPPAAPLAPPAPPAPGSIDSETLRDELRKDGLIGASDTSFQFQLSPAGMTVNGKKQPDDVANKYRKLTGHETGSYNMMISIN